MPAASEVVIPIRAVDNTNKAFASVKKSLHSLQQSVFSVQSAVAGLTAAFGVGQMTKFLDTATRIENRLKLVTKSSEELVKAQQDVAAIAKITGQNYEQTANLYSRIIQSTESLNLSTKDQLTITQTVAKSLAITGESSESAAAAIKQLGQALASGVLRGEEFNSVAEQAPRVMKALQDSLGVSRGKLRELAKEGALTSEIVAEALLIQAETVDKEFGKTTRTVAQAYENLNTSAVKFFDILDEKLGISEKYNSVINRMARGLDKVTESMKGATKIELKKQIEELTSAQQKELIELDALVMGNNSLNLMQQNQARILRLNIAERGKHIKELRAEYDELVNGKKATEDSSTATNENTEQTKEASEASKKLQERLTALRAKLDEKTESTKKATKSVADLSLEFEHAYTMGNVTARTYQNVRDINEELIRKTIDLSVAMEQTYTMGNLNVTAYKEVKKVNEELIQKTIDLSVAMEQTYTMGNLNAAAFQEVRDANEKLIEKTIALSTAMEESYSMGNLNAQAFQDVRDVNEKLIQETIDLSVAMERTYSMGNLNVETFQELVRQKEELAEKTSNLSVAMERTYSMGNLNAQAFQDVKEANEALAEKTTQLSLAMEQTYTMANLNRDAFAEVRDINREATDSMIELSLAMEQTYTMGNLNVEAFKEMKKAAATAFPKQLAENEYFQGITAAGGEAGARAMTVTKAFAESTEKGLFALMMSNKKVQEALEKVFTAIFALIDPIIDLLAPQIEALIPLFKSLNPLIAKLTPAISKLTPPLEKIIDPLIKLVENVIYLVEKLEEFTDFLEEKLGAFVIALSEVIEAIGGKILEIVTGAIEFLAGIFDALKILFENTLGPLKTAIETLYNSYLKPILEKLQPLIDAFKPLTDALNDLKNAIESKKDIFEKGGPLDPGGSTGGKFVQGFVSTVASIGSSLGFKNGGMIPKAQNGMLVGASHSMGGTMVAAEGGEYIFSREAVQRLGAGRLNQLNNGQDNGGVVVNIYDGTGQRISAYDSALRVEIKERAARNQQFAAVA